MSRGGVTTHPRVGEVTGVDGGAQPGERAVLGDPHGTGGHAEHPGCLVGAHPDADAQGEDLTLLLGQGLQQPPGGGGALVREHGRERVVTVHGVGDLVGRDRSAQGRALHVRHLARGDGVDEGLEGRASVDVAGQGLEHGETHLLGSIVGGVDPRGETTESGTAVAIGQGADVRHQLVHRLRVRARGAGHHPSGQTTITG
ncbi:hypothetical protein GCM10025862_25260 [Arsenicicoccus piscis]|uniref:Uncharacterized protein n=1 Tax=Arsenicicoccus piscis TaxID=673954 RepID=A0ABQ6HSH2_9MICO|nr:hypothetical protein GCM10025862_25260 [Arsenicicoccus piscis]